MPIRGRDDLHFAQRVVIKAGTSVVSTPEGYPSLSRMSGLVENVRTRVKHHNKLFDGSQYAITYCEKKKKTAAISSQQKFQSRYFFSTFKS